MLKSDIVIVSSGTLDTVFILKILDKFKSKKILLITEREISKNVFELSQIYNLKILKLHAIYFSYEFKFTEYIQIPKILINYYKLKKAKLQISNKSRIYFFNEFYSFSTFASYAVLKKFKHLFIRSIRFLEIQNFNKKELHSKNFSKLKIFNIYINIFLLNFFFRELKLSYYQIDKNYYRDEINYDFYKVEGYGFNENYKYTRIFPYNLKSNSNKKSKNPLYLFAPVEQTSTFGINLNQTYFNFFLHIQNNFNEIDIKIHPSLKDSTWIKDLSNKVKINFIEANLPAEYFLDMYDVVYVNFVSNSIRHFIENNNKTNIKFYSLINLIVFDNISVNDKFFQMFDVVYYNFKNKINKIER